ncbi:MAG: hypothetical protein A2845_00170 [Candidatus Lloydbacteria bacterium RIFCSPHIGHO2_01_FULL_49_22]|uniref:Uncharacterized protein n=1 Tax=Candidatus Lloydbacteria bacterium RIFCSPHIGHO2_01_FULL_49_22 TaxID=1798658 RepID=A0A1G2CYC6_9BACT|nr:MAG: hypothetical protein A2845_00170 [Candidatus Lloydbacteria bacterium RIFCSPHIGHO2_01_FULL_49_22]OGZ09283.1 MAG: hypothetical protein A3C14_05075 [Candidatus Lloydbacteria bacterium RIFCSPHIGHO2_02_FULL_50_18]
MKYLAILVKKLKQNISAASRILIAVTVVIVGGAIAFGVYVHPTEADTGIPFGGLSTWIQYCTCTGPGVIAVTVMDLSTTPGTPTNYIYYPGGTILHPEYNIYSLGVWLLGNRSPGGVCMYWVGKICVTWPTDGSMVRVGTSL